MEDQNVNNRLQQYFTTLQRRLLWYYDKMSVYQAILKLYSFFLLTSPVGFQLSLHLISPTKATCASFPRVPKSETSVCNPSYPLVTGRDQRQEKIKHSHSHQHLKYSSPLGPVFPSGRDGIGEEWLYATKETGWHETGCGDGGSVCITHIVLRKCLSLVVVYYADEARRRAILYFSFLLL